MNRKGFQVAMGLQWAVIPIVMLQYWRAWNQLPMRIATHFNAAGQPNGWMRREESLWFIVGLLAFLLTLFSVIAVVARKTGSKAIGCAFLAFSWCVVGFIAIVNNAVIHYNLTGEPIHFSAYMFAIPLPIILLIAAVLASQRGSELPDGRVIAEEVHASSAWGLGFVMLGIIALVVVIRLHAGAANVPLAIVAMVFLIVGAAAWSGFHYSFTPHGVDVRTLGFRLKSIPAQQVQKYTVDRWKPTGGYGIRGIGNCRAYVWGNQGIWINTASERVFLGHEEPERLVRDMDRMMKSVRT